MDLITRSRQVVDTETEQLYRTLISKRKIGVPVAHLTGLKEFWSLEFNVTEDTLIPRPETELLVEMALALIDRQSKCSVLDLGTGTGAIAIAIASERLLARVIAVDSSPAALAVAQENAQKHKTANVRFTCSNWFETIQDQTFDLIISNPPYVARDDYHLNQGDVRFEPRQALVSGNDGLDDLRRIVSQAGHFLTAQGWLLVEHGHQHSNSVRQLFEYAGYQQIQHRADLNAVPRITMGQCDHDLSRGRTT